MVSLIDSSGGKEVAVWSAVFNWTLCSAGVNTRGGNDGEGSVRSGCYCCGGMIGVSTDLGTDSEGVRRTVHGWKCWVGTQPMIPNLFFVLR